MLRYLLALSVLMASLATAQETVDWSSLVEKVMPTVVTIVSADAKDIVQGSGFIISSDGKIVTNFHIVTGKPAILARRLDGSFLIIKGILALDKESDLAILQAEGRNLPFVLLGDSDEVKVGEAICVIGSPMLLEGTVSAGIISAVRDLRDGRKLLQITAPISEGSSGSPVFNRKGEVIGVASFTLSKGQNLNFAVPSNAVKALLRRLGISTKPLSPLPTLSLEERFEQAYQEAFQVAQEFEIASIPCSLLLKDIAIALAKAGQFDRAIQIAQKIEDALSRSLALKEIALALAKAGQFDRAIQIAQKIENLLDRSLALKEIALALAKAGQFDQAIQIAQKIDEPWRSLALEEIAVALVKAGQFDQTIQTAQKIEGALALKEIAVALAEVGQFYQAIQIAQKIKDALDRSSALEEIAVALAKAGQFYQAIQIAQKIEDALRRSSALHDIAVALAEAGQFYQAIQIARKIMEDEMQAFVLKDIVAALARAGRFDRAVEVAETIDHPITRLQALATIIAAKRDAERVKRRNGEGVKRSDK